MVQKISKLISFFIVLLATNHCYAIKPSNLPEAIMLKYIEVYNNRDLQGVLKLFTKNSRNWGTGIDEYRIGLKELEAQLKRDWTQSEKSIIEINSIISSNEKEPLWAAGIFTVHITIDGTIHSFTNFRGSIILAKEDGEWKIAHSHASFPATNEAEGESFPKK